LIIKETPDKKNILFEPESIKERTFLESFPGFLREGLYFFSPNKPRVIYNLYQRLRRKVKDLKYSTYVQTLVTGSFPLKELPETFKFHTKPLAHQLLALKFLYTQGSAGLLLDPGLGKTKVILDFIYLMGFKRAIIVCPKPLLGVWGDERVKHRPELTMETIQDTSWTTPESPCNITVVNYSKAEILHEQLLKLSPDFIGLDESLIKDHTTNRTNGLTKLGKRVPYKCIMSGTLVNNTPLDSFAPIRFIEPAAIGEGVTHFKDRYAVTARTNKNILVGFRDIPEIKSILDATCIVMRKDEWLKDLPVKRFHRIICNIQGESKDIYNDLVSNWMFEHKGAQVVIDNPLTRMSKLLQIANGFYYYNEDPEVDPLAEVMGDDVKVKKGPRHQVLLEDFPKITALDSLIKDPERFGQRRAIIWFNFQAEYDILKTYLDSIGVKWLSVKGGEKKVGEKIRAFNTDPSYRFIVCQAKTINYGVTILGTDKEDYELPTEFDTHVADQIFYSLNFSLEVFLQQQDRIHRIGQTNECNYWFLLTSSCIEEKVWKAMQDKTLLNKMMLVDISQQVALL
jgi:SNF2 family DNA or RNA helicase